MAMLYVKTAAQFSECGTYRYMLMRLWNDVPAPRLCMWSMLNPSTATAETDDPTVAKTCRYSARWGFDGNIITNAFAIRSTNPQILLHHPNPVGPDNLAVIRHWAEKCEAIVCAWGVHRALDFFSADEAVLKVFREVGKWPLCLAISKNGKPVHPLYQRGDLNPRVYDAGIQAT